MRVERRAARGRVTVRPGSAARRRCASRPTAGRLVATVGRRRASCRASPSSRARPTRSTVDGVVAVLARPPTGAPGHDRGAGDPPDGRTVPRNLLRCTSGSRRRCARAAPPGTSGSSTTTATALVGALLPTEHELWDSTAAALTVLLDPARIKRGLVAHRHLGYPLREPVGAFRVVVDEGSSTPRRRPCGPGPSGATRWAATSVATSTPHRGTLAAPHPTTAEPAGVTFDRPLDHGLLARCLRVARPDGRSSRLGEGRARGAIVDAGAPPALAPTRSTGSWSTPRSKTSPATRCGGSSTGT